MLSGPSNYEVKSDGRILIKSLNKYYSPRKKIQVGLINEDGSVYQNFNSILECANFLGCSSKLVTNRLKDLKSVLHENRILYIKKVYTDSENTTDNNILNASMFSFISLPSMRYLFSLVKIFYNKYITNLVLNLGGQTTKTLDKGSIEFLGPFGLEKALIKLSKNISSLSTSIVTSYALYILLGLISYLAFYSLNTLILYLVLLIILMIFLVIAANYDSLSIQSNNKSFARANTDITSPLGHPIKEKIYLYIFSQPLGVRGL